MKRRAVHGKIVRIGNRRVVTKGLTTGLFVDFYHTAMQASWSMFLIAAGFIFGALNTVFAGLYLLFPGSVANVPPDQPWHVLFFSIETLATVGYGDMHPLSEWGHWVASLESFVGLIFSAVLTGAIFSRFSRPTARLLFSRHAVIGQFEGQPHLMLRVANARVNMISDAVAKLWLLSTTFSAEGRRFRRYHELKLDRLENPSFVLSWILFHRIDADSPLYGWDRQRMEEAEVQLILSVRGNDESVSQELRSRHTYKLDDIAFDHQFVDVITNDEDGNVVVDYRVFHDITPEELAETDDLVEEVEA